MKAALAGVLIAWLCLLQGAYGVANLAPEVTDPANFLPPRILIRADVTTSIKPSRPQTFDRQGTASALPLWLSREPLGESESINLYVYCQNDPINKVDVLGLFETQVQVDNLRMDLLLGQLLRDPHTLPTSPPQEAIDILRPFPNAEKFGLSDPYSSEDYQRAQTHVQSIGVPTMRSLSWEDAERSRKHALMPAPEWIPSTTSALTIGAANTPLNASINSDWLLPTGAGGAGLKFLFGGAKLKAALPVLTAGAKVDGRAIAAELRTGEMLANAAKGSVADEVLLLTHRAGNPRYLPGAASYGGGLPQIQAGQPWLRGSHGNAGKIPDHIARQLSGQRFNTFDDFRGAFWQAVGNDANLASQFSTANRRLMRQGLAPVSHSSQQVGKRIKFELDHLQEIQHGGNVYDMNNIIIRTPLNHIYGK